MTADREKLPDAARSGEPARTPARDVAAFLTEARSLAPAAGGSGGRLLFALDATMSRQPTWDLAVRVQAEMFSAAGDVGGLMVQLVYFRGFGECRASRWVADARSLTGIMTQISCRGGHTQIGRVLAHVRQLAADGRPPVLVYVGDAMEERLDDLCQAAGELGLRGVKAFMFHEGHDAAAATAFHEIARLTGGAYARFDAGAGQALAGLLRAAAVFASGGLQALQRLAVRESSARRLVAQLGGVAAGDR